MTESTRKVGFHWNLDEAVEDTLNTAGPSEGSENIEGDGSNVNIASHPSVCLSYIVRMFVAIHALKGEDPAPFCVAEVI